MPKVWQVLAALVASFFIAAGFVGAIETAEDQAALRESVAKKDATIDRVLEWQKRTQERLDELADQNAELVELLREQGIKVPASLVTRTTTRTVERDDDDDGGDTVIVRPSSPTSRPTTRPPTSRPPADNDDDLTDVVPKVDNLPEPVGKATDDVKDIADDALDGTIPLIP